MNERIPKIKKVPPKDNLQYVDINNRDVQHLLRDVNKTCLDTDFSQHWTAIKVSFVHNSELEANYKKKKCELKECRTAQSLKENLGFLEITSCQKQKIVREGLQVYSQPFNKLGKEDCGVCLSRFFDVEFKYSWQFGTSLKDIFVFKFISGKCKSIRLDNVYSKSGCFEPTPNYDSHISSLQPKTSDHLFVQKVRSGIYLYEYTEDCEPSKCPRQCLPFAVISCTMVEKPTKSMAPSFTREKAVAGEKQNAHKASKPEKEAVSKPAAVKKRVSFAESSSISCDSVSSSDPVSPTALVTESQEGQWKQPHTMKEAMSPERKRKMNILISKQDDYLQRLAKAKEVLQQEKDAMFSGLHTILPDQSSSSQPEDCSSKQTEIEKKDDRGRHQSLSRSALKTQSKQQRKYKLPVPLLNRFKNHHHPHQVSKLSSTSPKQNFQKPVQTTQQEQMVHQFESDLASAFLGNNNRCNRKKSSFKSRKTNVGVSNLHGDKCESKSDQIKKVGKGISKSKFKNVETLKKAIKSICNSRFVSKDPKKSEAMKEADSSELCVEKSTSSHVDVNAAVVQNTLKRSEKTGSEPKPEEIELNQKSEKRDLNQRHEKNYSSHRLEKNHSNQSHVKGDSSQTCEKTEPKQKHEKTDSSQKYQKIDSNQKRENIQSEQRPGKTDSDQSPVKTNSSQKREKIDNLHQKLKSSHSNLKPEKILPDQRLEKTSSGQDCEKIDSNQNLEKSHSKQRPENADSNQKLEKNSLRQKCEKIDSSQKLEKIQTKERPEKTNSSQKCEKIDSIQKLGKIHSKQRLERSYSNQNPERNNSDQLCEKIDSNQKLGKIHSKQRLERSYSNQNPERNSSGQKHERLDSNQKLEKIHSKQRPEKTNSNQKRERSSSDQMREKIDSNQKPERNNPDQMHGKTDSNQKPERSNSDQMREKIDSNQKLEKLHSKQKPEKADSNQKLEKTKSDQMHEDTDLNQKPEKNNSFHKSEKIDLNLKLAKIHLDQRPEKTDLNQIPEKTNSNQECEKINSNQKLEKINSKQRSEHVDSYQKPEKVSSSQKWEKLHSNEKLEKMDLTKKPEKSYSGNLNQMCEKNSSNQEIVKLDFNKNAEDSNPNQKCETNDCNQVHEACTSNQRIEKVYFNKSPEKNNPSQKSETSDFNQIYETCDSIQKLELVYFNNKLERGDPNQTSETSDLNQKHETSDSSQKAEEIYRDPILPRRSFEKITARNETGFAKMQKNSYWSLDTTRTLMSNVKGSNAPEHLPEIQDEQQLQSKLKRYRKYAKIIEIVDSTIHEIKDVSGNDEVSPASATDVTPVESRGFTRSISMLDLGITCYLSALSDLHYQPSVSLVDCCEMVKSVEEFPDCKDCLKDRNSNVLSAMKKIQDTSDNEADKEDLSDQEEDGSEDDSNFDDGSLPPLHIDLSLPSTTDASFESLSPPYHLQMNLSPVSSPETKSHAEVRKELTSEYHLCNKNGQRTPTAVSQFTAEKDEKVMKDRQFNIKRNLSLDSSSHNHQSWLSSEGTDNMMAASSSSLGQSFSSSDNIPALVEKENVPVVQDSQNSFARSESIKEKLSILPADENVLDYSQPTHNAGKEMSNGSKTNSSLKLIFDTYKDGTGGGESEAFESVTSEGFRGEMVANDKETENNIDKGDDEENDGRDHTSIEKECSQNITPDVVDKTDTEENLRVEHEGLSKKVSHVYECHSHTSSSMNVSLKCVKNSHSEIGATGLERDCHTTKSAGDVVGMDPGSHETSNCLNAGKNIQASEQDKKETSQKLSRNLFENVESMWGKKVTRDVSSKKDILEKDPKNENTTLEKAEVNTVRTEKNILKRKQPCSNEQGAGGSWVSDIHTHKRLKPEGKISSDNREKPMDDSVCLSSHLVPKSPLGEKNSWTSSDNLKQEVCNTKKGGNAPLTAASRKEIWSNFRKSLKSSSVYTSADLKSTDSDSASSSYSHSVISENKPEKASAFHNRGSNGKPPSNNNYTYSSTYLDTTASSSSTSTVPSLYSFDIQFPFSRSYSYSSCSFSSLDQDFGDVDYRRQNSFSGNYSYTQNVPSNPQDPGNRPFGKICENGDVDYRYSVDPTPTLQPANYPLAEMKQELDGFSHSDMVPSYFTASPPPHQSKQASDFSTTNEISDIFPCDKANKTAYAVDYSSDGVLGAWNENTLSNHSIEKSKKAHEVEVWNKNTLSNHSTEISKEAHEVEIWNKNALSNHSTEISKEAHEVEVWNKNTLSNHSTEISKEAHEVEAWNKNALSNLSTENSKEAHEVEACNKNALSNHSTEEAHEVEVGNKNALSIHSIEKSKEAHEVETQQENTLLNHSSEKSKEAHEVETRKENILSNHSTEKSKEAHEVEGDSESVSTSHLSLAPTSNKSLIPGLDVDTASCSDLPELHTNTETGRNDIDCTKGDIASNDKENDVEKLLKGLLPKTVTNYTELNQRKCKEILLKFSSEMKESAFNTSPSQEKNSSESDSKEYDSQQSQKAQMALTSLLKEAQQMVPGSDTLSYEAYNLKEETNAGNDIFKQCKEAIEMLTKQGVNKALEVTNDAGERGDSRLSASTSGNSVASEKWLYLNNTNQSDSQRDEGREALECSLVESQFDKSFSTLSIHKHISDKESTGKGKSCDDSWKKEIIGVPPSIVYESDSPYQALSLGREEQNFYGGLANSVYQGNEQKQNAVPQSNHSFVPRQTLQECEEPFGKEADLRSQYMPAVVTTTEVSPATEYSSRDYISYEPGGTEVKVGASPSQNKDNLSPCRQKRFIGENGISGRTQPTHIQHSLSAVEGSENSIGVGQTEENTSISKPYLERSMSCSFIKQDNSNRSIGEHVSLPKSALSVMEVNVSDLRQDQSLLLAAPCTKLSDVVTDKGIKSPCNSSGSMRKSDISPEGDTFDTFAASDKMFDPKKNVSSETNEKSVVFPSDNDSGIRSPFTDSDIGDHRDVSDEECGELKETEIITEDAEEQDEPLLPNERGSVDTTRASTPEIHDASESSSNGKGKIFLSQVPMEALSIARHFILDQLNSLEETQEHEEPDDTQQEQCEGAEEGDSVEDENGDDLIHKSPFSEISSEDSSEEVSSGHYSERKSFIKRPSHQQHSTSRGPLMGNKMRDNIIITLSSQSESESTPIPKGKLRDRNVLRCKFEEDTIIIGSNSEDERCVIRDPVKLDRNSSPKSNSQDQDKKENLDIPGEGYEGMHRRVVGVTSRPLGALCKFVTPKPSIVQVVENADKSPFHDSLSSYPVSEHRRPSLSPQDFSDKRLTSSSHERISCDRISVDSSSSESKQRVSLDSSSFEGKQHQRFRSLPFRCGSPHHSNSSRDNNISHCGRQKSFSKGHQPEDPRQGDSSRVKNWHDEKQRSLPRAYCSPDRRHRSSSTENQERGQRISSRNYNRGAKRRRSSSRECSRDDRRRRSSSREYSCRDSRRKGSSSREYSRDDRRQRSLSREHSTDDRRRRSSSREHSRDDRRRRSSSREHSRDDRRRRSSSRDYHRGDRRRRSSSRDYHRGDSRQRSSSREYSRGGRRQRSSSREYRRSARRQRSSSRDYSGGDRRRRSSSSDYENPGKRQRSSSSEFRMHDGRRLNSPSQDDKKYLEISSSLDGAVYKEFKHLFTPNRKSQDRSRNSSSLDRSSEVRRDRSSSSSISGCRDRKGRNSSPPHGHYYDRRERSRSRSQGHRIGDSSSSDLDRYCRNRRTNNSSSPDRGYHERRGRRSSSRDRHYPRRRGPHSISPRHGERTRRDRESTSPHHRDSEERRANSPTSDQEYGRRVDAFIKRSSRRSPNESMADSNSSFSMHRRGSGYKGRVFSSFRGKY